MIKSITNNFQPKKLDSTIMKPQMEKSSTQGIALSVQLPEATNQIALAMHRPIILKVHPRLPKIIWESIIMSQIIIILLLALAVPTLRMNPHYVKISGRHQN